MDSSCSRYREVQFHQEGDVWRIQVWDGIKWVTLKAVYDTAKEAQDAIKRMMDVPEN